MLQPNKILADLTTGGQMDRRAMFDCVSLERIETYSHGVVESRVLKGVDSKTEIDQVTIDLRGLTEDHKADDRERIETFEVNYGHLNPEIVYGDDKIVISIAWEIP